MALRREFFLKKLISWYEKKGREQGQALFDKLDCWSCEEGRLLARSSWSVIEDHIELLAPKRGISSQRFVEELFARGNADDFMTFFEFGFGAGA